MKILFYSLLCLISFGITERGAEALPTTRVKTFPSQGDHSPASAPGFLLYPSLGDHQVYLFDHRGRLHHQWAIKTVRAKLLPNGNLLAIVDEALHEYDWSGNQVWEVRAEEGEIHHDFERTADGRTLFLVEKRFRHLPSPEAEYSKAKRRVRSDIAREVDSAGKTRWEWHFDRSLDIHSCGTRPCAKGADAPIWRKRVRDWSHANTVRFLPPNRWHDEGDPRFAPGNVITMARNLWSGYIVDRKKKQVVWSYSENPLGGLQFPHEAHMIRKGLPGAGNILIFDNGTRERGSIALEIEPTTGEIVWKYENGTRFFSNGHGSLQRLPNGNTLLSEDFRNRILEVTPGGDVVWKMKGPAGLRRASKYPPTFAEPLSRIVID
ncbi:aryl-sulfate sulfotransferase [bacterium]|nr:aryl-sulfate sulfotransferase [bacterium]